MGWFSNFLKFIDEPRTKNPLITARRSSGELRRTVTVKPVVQKRKPEPKPMKLAPYTPPPQQEPEDPITVERKRLERRHQEIDLLNISALDRADLHADADRAFVQWCRRSINGY